MQKGENMAKPETKELKVTPLKKDETVKKMQRYGWTLEDAHEILSKNAHTEQKDDTVYTVTQKVNYVKLTFSRDTEGENYRKYVKLEEFDKTDVLLQQLPGKTPRKYPRMVWWIYVLLLALSALAGWLITEYVFKITTNYAIAVACFGVAVFVILLALIFVVNCFIIYPGSMRRYNKNVELKAELQKRADLLKAEIGDIAIAQA